MTAGPKRVIYWRDLFAPGSHRCRGRNRDRDRLRLVLWLVLPHDVAALPEFVRSQRCGPARPYGRVHCIRFLVSKSRLLSFYSDSDTDSDPDIIPTAIGMRTSAALWAGGTGNSLPVLRSNKKLLLKAPFVPMKGETLCRSRNGPDQGRAHNAQSRITLTIRLLLVPIGVGVGIGIGIDSDWYCGWSSRTM
jgi:hypothetical protein